MTTKKTTPVKGTRVYVLPGGAGLIAAQELDRQELGKKSGTTIWIRNPAFVSTRENGNGFVFNPLRFVDGDFELFTGSVVGAFDMPSDMAEWYERYVQVQEEERENAPLQ